MSGVTARTVWEHLAQGRPLDELTRDAPEHFVTWVVDTAARLRAEYTDLERQCRDALARARVAAGDRRATAAYVESFGDRAPVMFKMLDGRPYDQLVWRMLRPAGDTRFRPDPDR